MGTELKTKETLLKDYKKIETEVSVFKIKPIQKIKVNLIRIIKPY